MSWGRPEEMEEKKKYFMNNFKGGGRLEVLYICLLFLILFLG